ncbi:N-formylglutamate amidohydrolase [Bradyrhizobium sp. LjRoot220]
MAVARTQHDAVFAERHRVRVAIYGLVVNRQERHRGNNHREFRPANLYRTLLICRSKCRFDRQCLRKNALNHAGDTSLLLGPADVPPVREYNEAGRSPFLLTCDHYGRLIPQALGDLGLPESELKRHIAWDIGIAGVAEILSKHLNAHLIVQRYSRLVIDSNRPPQSASSIPLISETTTIPGNEAIARGAAELRRAQIFDPYHRRIGEIIDARRQRNMPTILVSLHSFTPVYAGIARPWHIGTLYQRDKMLPPLLLQLLRAEPDLVVGDNEPYAVSDDTDYTIPVHGEARGLMNTGIEIRQDLISDQAGEKAWANRLARILGEIEMVFRSRQVI